MFHVFTALRSRSITCYLVPVAAGLLITLSAARAEAAVTLLSETFEADPIAAGHATVVGPAGSDDRFTYNPGSDSLTASYDTSRETAKVVWELPGNAALTEQDTFGFDATFTIDDLDAAFDQFAQVAFGLINTGTTGTDRPGGTFDESRAAFDVVTFDYFPNLSSFASPTLGSTINETNVGQGYLADFSADPFEPGAINFPFGPESDLGDESFLSTQTTLTASVFYDPTIRATTLTVSDNSGLLNINLDSDGGADNDTTTIQTFLPDHAAFTVNAFALTLWEDTFAVSETPAVVGDLTFDSFAVTGAAPTQVIPEPTALALMGVLGGMMALRRPRRRVTES